MQIDVIGLEDIRETLEDIEDKTANLKPLLKEIANHLENTVNESFETQTSPDGTSWSPIKKATHKNYKLGTDKILYATGHMQGSLYSRVYKKSLTVGVNATSNDYQYPLVQQFGRKDGTIEARAFMPIKLDGSIYEKTEKELDEIVEDYFEEMGLK